MLVAAAVCPHPPLLIPAAMGAAGLRDSGPGDSGSGAAGSHDAAWNDTDTAGQDPDAELRGLRVSCADAVAGLLAAGPDLLVVVGGAPATAAYDGYAAGSLWEYGVPFVVGCGEPVLPLSLTVGAWLLDQAGGKPRRAAGQPRQEYAGGQPPRCGLPCRLMLRAVAADLPPADCLRLGAELAALAPRVALLAMGDACARKATGVPGAADPAGERYDAQVAAALAAGDAAGLARLDPALDDELMIAGRAAWQVLAGAAGDGALRGRLRCAVAPYDVSYLVASWDRDQRAAALAD